MSVRRRCRAHLASAGAHSGQKARNWRQPMASITARAGTPGPAGAWQPESSRSMSGCAAVDASAAVPTSRLAPGRAPSARDALGSSHAKRALPNSEWLASRAISLTAVFCLRGVGRWKAPARLCAANRPRRALGVAANATAPARRPPVLPWQGYCVGVDVVAEEAGARGCTR